MRGIALALFIAATLPIIFAQPYAGLLVWSWLGYMNPHRLTYGFAYSFPWVELVAIVTLVSLLVSKESKRIEPSATVILMILFFAWVTVATFFAAQSAVAWPKWEEFGKTLIMVFVTLMLVKHRRRVHWLIWMIVISLGFYGLKGGIFTIVTGGAFHVLGPADSFIANNNDLAQALCMTLPMMRYLQLQAKTKFFRIGMALSMLLTGVAILGTYSRGGLIALTVVLAVLLFRSRRRMMVLVVFAMLAITAYQFMPAKWMSRMSTLHHASRTLSAQERFRTWKFAANVALHNPILGGGFEVYEDPAMWRKYAPEGAIERAVHSIYFRVLGEQGFPGLILFLALLFISLRNCARVRRATRDSIDDKWAFDLASMLQVSLLAFMTAGLASTSAYFDLTYQIMAVTALLRGMVEEQHVEAKDVSGAAEQRPRAIAAVGAFPVSREDV